MSRWIIEKDGTGIEKSGTGIEKAGTGIEKSGTGVEKAGTGVEKSGTGIEKSGTGIRHGLLACSLAAFVGVGSVNAGNVDPAGTLQLVVQNNTVAVSWIIGDSVFSGVSTLNGSYANLLLTEVSLAAADHDLLPPLVPVGHGEVAGPSVRVDGDQEVRRSSFTSGWCHPVCGPIGSPILRFSNVNVGYNQFVSIR